MCEAFPSLSSKPKTHERGARGSESGERAVSKGGFPPRPPGTMENMPVVIGRYRLSKTLGIGAFGKVKCETLFFFPFVMRVGDKEVPTNVGAVSRVLCQAASSCFHGCRSTLSAAADSVVAMSYDSSVRCACLRLGVSYGPTMISGDRLLRSVIGNRRTNITGASMRCRACRVTSSSNKLNRVSPSIIQRTISSVGSA